MHIHYVTVFSDRDKQNIKGNAAAVIICDKLLGGNCNDHSNGNIYNNNATWDLSSEPSKLALSQQLLASKYFADLDPPSVICFIDNDSILDPNSELSSNQNSNLNNKIKTACFSAHSKIQLCGHGTLAANAAYQLHADNGEPSIFNPASSNSYQSDGQLHWLKLAGIEVSETAVPEWAAAAFSNTPTRAAIAGDTRDYLIFEWPSETQNLATISADFNTIKTHTQRAVIATQWLATNKPSNQCLPHYDFAQRYFAPQYGSNEDSATGSAHRVLASYWHNRTGQKRFTAWQCSAAGGILHSHLYTDLHNGNANNSIWIGGQVQISDIIEISL